MGKRMLVVVVCWLSLTVPLLSLPVDFDEENQPHSVNITKLFERIDKADCLIVVTGPRDYQEEDSVLFQSTNRKDLDALKASIIVKLQLPRDGGYHCMCDGSPAILLFDGMRLIATISNHHGISIRDSLWGSNVTLADQEKWIKWFDDRGIPAVRKEVEESRQNQEASRIALNRWQAAIPASLKAVWNQTDSNDLDTNLEPLRHAIAKEFPEPRARIRMLLNLYGSGRGPWSGYPTYESIAENLLLDYDTPALLDAIQSAPLSTTETEGTARLFAGWDFNRKRPDDRNKLPTALKQQLWEHTQNTSDKDNLDRARNAYTH